jgi:phosphatidylserine/phosphatidylglycerophosphate/cardiolipin synthase-like enzyme
VKLPSFSAYRIEKTVRLANGDYFDFLSGQIQEARKRVWAANFIINPVVSNDPSLAVRGFLKRLAYAQWRNVDVRVLVGTSHVRDIRVANHTARLYLTDLGVPIRSFIGKLSKSLHSKYVIVDDEVIVVGSHNWTPGAFGDHSEESLAIYSHEMNLILRDEFLANWSNSEPVGKVLE